MRTHGPHPLTRRYFFNVANDPIADPTAESVHRIFEVAPGAMVDGEDMDREKREIPFILQAEHVMRNGDIVRIGKNEKGAGQHVENFIKSPSVFPQHCTWTTAIARVNDLRQVLDEAPFPTTRGIVQFHADPLNEYAQLMWTVYRDRMQNAGSTGIWVMAWEAIRAEGQEGIPDFFLPWDCTESELMEFSLVGIPNDPMALQQNGAPAASVDLLSRVANSASLASHSDAGPHAAAVARYLVNAIGRDAFAEVLGRLPSPPAAPEQTNAAPETTAPVPVPPAALPPARVSEAELNAIATYALSKLN